MTTTNENCLCGFRCPACGSSEPFRIEVATIVTVFDEGGDDIEGIEWEQSSFCECCECHQHGTVAEFTGGRSHAG